MKRYVLVGVGLLSLSGIIVLVLPKQIFPSFYDVRYMGLSAIVGASVILFLPKFLRVSPQKTNAKQKNHGAELFQLFLFIAVVSNAVGDLGLYELYRFGFQFDKLIHFTTTLLAVYVLSQVLEERFALAFARARIYTCCIVVGSIVGWEFYEYIVDQLWFTHLYGVFGSDTFKDTKLDITFGLVGLVIGLLLSTFRPLPKSDARLTS